MRTCRRNCPNWIRTSITDVKDPCADHYTIRQYVEAAYKAASQKGNHIGKQWAKTYMKRFCGLAPHTQHFNLRSIYANRWDGKEQPSLKKQPHGSKQKDLDIVFVRMGVLGVEPIYG